jgi:hypothetical protein
MLPSPSGLREDENACVPGAQTERRGEAEFVTITLRVMSP